MSPRLRSPFGRLLVWAVFVCLFAAAGCNSEVEEKGVVARVNGEPVYLEQIESKYDLMHTSSAVVDAPSVERLKSDYGHLLGDIIVQKLVSQELEARSLSVTQEELDEAEAEVRADYPDPEVFEQVLIEEYIDLAAWRRELKARIALKKFFNLALRPEVTITYQEAEAYYRKNIKDFYLPPRYELIVIQGPSRDAVTGAVENYEAEGDVEKLAGRFKELTVEKVKIREDRLTMDWKNAINGLKPGEAGPVLAGDQSFTSLIYLNKSPAHVIELPRAYPIVERVLLEHKLRTAFENWLSREIDQATIEINPHIDLDAQYEEFSDEDANFASEATETGDDEFPLSELEKERELEESAADAIPLENGAENGEKKP